MGKADFGFATSFAYKICQPSPFSFRIYQRWFFFRTKILTKVQRAPQRQWKTGKGSSLMVSAAQTRVRPICHRALTALIKTPIIMCISGRSAINREPFKMSKIISVALSLCHQKKDELHRGYNLWARHFAPITFSCRQFRTRLSNS